VTKRKSDRILVRLRSTESGHLYHTEKNRRSARLELRRYDPLLRRHALYRETR
jgi:large subunit ribosomal protein L33